MKVAAIPTAATCSALDWLTVLSLFCGGRSVPFP